MNNEKIPVNILKIIFPPQNLATVNVPKDQLMAGKSAVATTESSSGSGMDQTNAPLLASNTTGT